MARPSARQGAQLGAQPGARQDARPGARRPATTQGRRGWPPVLAFALVMVGMSALAGFIGGVAVLARQPAVAVGCWLFGVFAIGIAWSLARGERRGYWSAVALLAFVGVLPISLAIAAGAGAAAIIFAPPLVVAAIMVRSTMRPGLVRTSDRPRVAPSDQPRDQRPDQPPDQPPDESGVSSGE